MLLQLFPWVQTKQRGTQTDVRMREGPYLIQPFDCFPAHAYEYRTQISDVAVTSHWLPSNVIRTSCNKTQTTQAITIMTNKLSRAMCKFQIALFENTNFPGTGVFGFFISLLSYP